MSDTPWTNVFSEINNVAHTVLKVEDSLLATNFLSLFKKKNYDEFNALFDHASLELTRIKLTMDLSIDKSKLIALKSFADALFDYTKILIRINYYLDLKAKGGEYPHASYQKDLQSLDLAREIIATRQDSIFN
jgi:hypothetical protein